MSVRVHSGGGPAPPKVGWALAVVLAAGILVFVLAGRLPGISGQSSTSTSFGDDRLIGPAASSPEIVAEVPGLVGRMLAATGESYIVVDAGGGAPSESYTVRGLDGSSLRADAAGDLVAALADRPGATLVAGAPGGELRTLSTSATSFSWHASIPGAIAWLTDDGGQTALLTAELIAETRTPVSTSTRLGLGPLDDAILAGWTGESYVIGARQDGRRVIIALDHRGFERWRRPGASAHLHRDEIVVVGEPEAAGVRFEFVSLADGALRRSWFLPDTVGGVAASPIGSLLAVTLNDIARGARLLLIDTDAMSVTSTFPVTYRVGHPTWSRDGRFVLLPGTDDFGIHVAVIVDVENAVSYAVAYEAAIVRLDLVVGAPVD